MSAEPTISDTWTIETKAPIQEVPPLSPEELEIQSLLKDILTIRRAFHEAAENALGMYHKSLRGTSEERGGRDHLNMHNQLRRMEYKELMPPKTTSHTITTPDKEGGLIILQQRVTLRLVATEIKNRVISLNRQTGLARDPGTEASPTKQQLINALREFKESLLKAAAQHDLNIRRTNTA